MTRIEQEKLTVSQMVEIYCQGNGHCTNGLCEECSVLLAYACERLQSCRFGEEKTTCKKCPIHCYKPKMREQMQQVMRYAGPRMILYHPITALKHVLREIK